MGEHPPDVRHHRVFAFFSLHKLIASLVFVAFFSPESRSSRAEAAPRLLPGCLVPRASCLVPGRSAGPPAIPSRRADPVGARGYFGHFWRAARLRQWRRPLRHGRPAPPRPALTFSLSPAGDAAALHANEAALMQMKPRPSPPRLRCRRRRGGRGSPGAPPRSAPPGTSRGSSAAGTRSAAHGGSGRAPRAQHGAPRADPSTAAAGRGAGSGGRPRGDAGRPEPTLSRDSR